MRSFREFLSFETYTALHLRENPTHYQALFAEHVVPAFSAFFFELVEAGRIVPLDTLKREIRFVQNWNLALSKGKHYEHSLCELAWTLVHYPMSMSALRNEENLEAGYELFIGQMDEGTIHFFSTSCEDAISGDSFQLDLNDWVPSFFTYGGRSYKDTTRIPATVLEYNPISTVEVEFTTGNMLIADWFRIKQFTEMTDFNNNSINFSIGRRDQALHYASLGFVGVVVGNSSPGLWQRGDAFIVGCNTDFDEEVTEGMIHDYITTDLWATTIIDRAKLEEMVGVETVAAYLAEEDVKTFQMTPGTYKLTFSGDYAKFSDLYIPTFDITGIDPYFILEKI